MAHGRKVARIKLEPPSPEDKKKFLSFWGAKELYENLDSYPPINANTFFKTNGTLSLEIGCGTGEFLVGLATENPEEKFLGVDFSRRAIYAAVNLAAKNCLENIHFIQADFKQLYPLLSPESLSMVYLHFPDPNYKAKHLKHRIFDNVFLDQMAIALAPSGKISVVTDEKLFFMDMLTIAEEDQRYVKTHQKKFLNSFNAKHKSRFHLAWERFNLPIFRFEIEKRGIGR